ncbi:hypothetical protein C5614_30410 [Massilia phosphatilytica]|nr:hypothetical protein C5614_30410 [Massilia phosphatilytica]
MPFLTHRIARLEAWFDRRTGFLRHERAPFVAAVLIPILFGLLSIALGQDDNWDLRNYHWYNPYALLNGRLHVDMAPGNWQSYFNPLIDVPYYVLNQWLPGPAVGFVMGFVHGLNFVLLLAIVRLMLPRDKADTRLCVLLAFAGMCGAGFLSEVGNTMGDNFSALFVLAALCLVLRGWDRLQAWSGRTAVTLLLAGLVMGLGAGLKLTNTSYAIALCIALLAVPASLRLRAVSAFVYGCGAIAGVAITAGPWWWRMWKTFGNPLFPQFNSIFKSPFAQQVAVIDAFHLPHNAVEALFWPFVFTAHFTRVSELVFRQAILPVLYVLALVFIGRWLFERVTGRAPVTRLGARGRFLLLFALVGYLAWMKLFSIYRYLIPLEMLAPLLVWILVERLAAPRIAGRIAGWVVLLATLVVFPFGTWGHAGWGARAFSAQLPTFEHPASTLVFTAHGDPPMGWLATFFPRDVRILSLGSGFPESPAYLDRIQAVIASRPGPHYAMLAASRNEKDSSLRRKLAAFQALGMTATPARCAQLDRLLHKVRFQVQVKTPAADGQACTLELQPQYVIDLAAQDRAIVQAATQNLARYGLKLDAAGCRHYQAAVGTDPYPIQMCPVTAGQ